MRVILMMLSDFERRDAKGQFSGSPYTCSYHVTNNGRNFRHANSWGRVIMGSSTTEGAAKQKDKSGLVKILSIFT